MYVQTESQLARRIRQDKTVVVGVCVAIIFLQLSVLLVAAQLHGCCWWCWQCLPYSHQFCGAPVLEPQQQQLPGKREKKGGGISASWLLSLREFALKLSDERALGARCLMVSFRNSSRRSSSWRALESPEKRNHDLKTYIYQIYRFPVCINVRLRNKVSQESVV